MSREEARLACEQLTPPAQLASIIDVAENDRAAALAVTVPFEPSNTNTNQRQRMWLGASSLAVVGEWTWIDGDPFEYSNWRVGEPGSPTTERCMVLLGSEAGLWDDRPCDLRYEAYLCKRE